MTFIQTLQELQCSVAEGGVIMGGLQGNIAPQIKQLLERSTPEEKKRIIDELKLRRMRQQQQRLAQMAAATGDQSLGMKQGDLLSGILKVNIFVSIDIRNLIKKGKETRGQLETVTYCVPANKDVIAQTQVAKCI